MPLTVAQLVARLTADTSGFYRSMAIANASMLRTGGLVTRAAAGIGIAVTGIGLVSLRAAGNFQQSMNILEAVSGATAKQMSTLNKEAIALGADFKLPNVSAKDAADAMQELAKGGLSVNQVMGATRGTLQLGIAANMSFSDSATIVARALSAFSLSGREATTVADLFTATANKSTADMTDVALGFQMASAQFAGTGHTIDELTTSLGLMANAGVVGSDAGTSLKTMINRLTAPTQKARDLMKDLGIQVYDSSGQMKSMPQLIGTLNHAFRGMSQEQRNAALYTIFGSDAIRAARIQMRAGQKGWNDFHDSITKGGEAQKFAEARTKGFNGALQALGSASETLAVQLGTYLLPTAEKLVRGMANFIGSIDPAKIAGFVGAIVNLVSGFKDLITGVPILTALVAGLTATFVAYRTAVILASAGMRIASTAMAILDATMAANPIVLVAAALIGLGVALVVLWKRSETFRAIVQGVWDWLKSAVLTTVNFIRQHWMLLAAIFSGGLLALPMLVARYFGQIKNISVRIFSAIIGFFRRWWPLLLVVMTLGTAIIVAQIIRHWRQIFNLTVSIFNAIKGVVSRVISAIVGVVRTVLSPVIGVVKTIWNGVKTAIGTVLGTIRSLVGNKFSALLSYIGGLAGLFIGYGMQIGEAIVSGILSGMGDLASAIGGRIADAAHGALGIAESALGIGSPSKLFADRVGVPISEGIAQGIAKGARAIPRSITNEMRHTIDTVAGGPLSRPQSVQALPSSASTTRQISVNLNVGTILGLGREEIADELYRLVRIGEARSY